MLPGLAGVVERRESVSTVENNCSRFIYRNLIAFWFKAALIEEIFDTQKTNRSALLLQKEEKRERAFGNAAFFDAALKMLIQSTPESNYQIQMIYFHDKYVNGNDKKLFCCARKKLFFANRVPRTVACETCTIIALKLTRLAIISNSFDLSKAQEVGEPVVQSVYPVDGSFWLGRSSLGVGRNVLLASDAEVTADRRSTHRATI